MLDHRHGQQLGPGERVGRSNHAVDLQGPRIRRHPRQHEGCVDAVEVLDGRPQRRDVRHGGLEPDREGRRGSGCGGKGNRRGRRGSGRPAAGDCCRCTGSDNPGSAGEQDATVDALPGVRPLAGTISEPAELEPQHSQRDSRPHDGGQPVELPGRRTRGRGQHSDQPDHGEQPVTDGRSADGEDAGDRGKDDDTHDDGADQHGLVSSPKGGDGPFLERGWNEVDDRCTDGDDRRGSRVHEDGDQLARRCSESCRPDPCDGRPGSAHLPSIAT